MAVAPRWTRPLKRRIGVVIRTLSGQKDARPMIVAGNMARNRGDGAAAIDHYGAALATNPKAYKVRVQLGHVLKDAGRLKEAETAYRIAAQDETRDADPWLHLGHALKLAGRHAEAAEAYAEALTRDAGLKAARDELIAIGGRDRLPAEFFGRAAAAETLGRVAAGVTMSLEAIQDGMAASIYPVLAWDAFRRAYPIQPPPDAAPGVPTVVLIDAGDAEPWAVRTTLLSLQDQRVRDWRALVQGPAALADHSVGALARIDPRIAFVAPGRAALKKAVGVDGETAILMIPAGARLHPEALGWFGAALRTTGAGAVYADHDHQLEHWRTGRLHVDPVLQPMPDADDLTLTPSPPVAVLAAASLRNAVLAAAGDKATAANRRRAVLLRAIAAGPVAHLPRVLTSLPAPLAVGDDPEIEAADIDAGDLDPGRILVVIPTRDEPALLAACIDSLHRHAARPEALDILVLDNRSTLRATAALLSRLTRAGRTRVRALDEPFNWSRFNNLAAAGGEAPYLVFANNDVEMLTPDWDDRLRTLLARPDAGVVGARLLYPDDSVQHAGMVLGCGDGRPFHEGVGAARADPGPLGRWCRLRKAAAVTGAFMACRRDVFEQVGGFDEARLAIGYNDIDFCLRVRALGLNVLYAGDLELTHHESKTRGLNDTRDKVAWDDGELFDLHHRWGAALTTDPGVNPQWASANGRAFDGYRDLTPRQIMDHVERSARPAPWAASPGDDAA